MSESEIRNPVTAIAESDATGEIAEIFADIRETMEIPLITSIWRILVDIEGGLRASWDAAKLLYKTGQPQAALLRIREEAVLPMPKPITVSQLTSVGVTKPAKLRDVFRSLINKGGRGGSACLLRGSVGIILPLTP